MTALQQHLLRFLEQRAPDLEQRVVLMTITGIFRLMRVGEVWLVQQRHDKLDVVDGETVSEEAWKVVAKATPGSAREGRTPLMEAYDFMTGADEKVQALIVEELEKKQSYAQPR